MRLPGASLVLAATTCLCLAGAAPSPASAAETGPQWTVTSVSRPTNFKPGDQRGNDFYLVTVINTGGAPTDGSPVVVTDELPAGLSLDAVGASGRDTLSGTTKLSCVATSCTYAHVVAPGQTLLLSVPVDVAQSPPASCQVPAGAASCVTNVVRVAGGGAADAGARTATVISTQAASFGISPGGAATALSSLQAGAHADLTSSIAFNTVDARGSVAADPKRVVYDLPPGFAGDLVDTPSCPASVFRLQECPITTQVGVADSSYLLNLNGKEFKQENSFTPLYNLSPDPGEVAKLGFIPGGVVFQEAGVYLRGEYGLETVFEDLPQNIAELNGASLTLWGVPADPIHDALRLEGTASGGTFGHHSSAALVPFFTNPTSCGHEPLQASFSVTSWQEPDAAPVHEPEPMRFGPTLGCDRLGIEPSLTAEVSTNQASAPTGFDLNTKIPQTYSNAKGLATSTLKREAVTLPEGMTVNPSAGAGLAGCTPAQFAEEGAQFVLGVGCPNESKLGTVKIVTPSLAEEVSGSVFLAQPYDNLSEFGEPLHPGGSLLALYVVARIPARGVLVKFAGKVEPNLETGRLVTTFDNLPPLPFSSAKFSFIQGPTSPLVTPAACGMYTVQAELTPYSEPAEVLSPAIPAFPITLGSNGGVCPSGAPPFHPQVISGTANNNAGAYSPFYLRIVREDDEQEITRFSTTLPAGLTGNLSEIPFCPDAAIEAARSANGLEELAHPSCPSATEIGHTLVGAGVGSTLAQTPGRLYLGGPYHGAPFSLVSITSAVVGPFDLGTVVIRFALRINPITAQVEVDASGSDPIPHIIHGIVVHVRDIRAYVDRPDFMLNPTNCGPLSISNTITGAGADPANPADQTPVAVTSPFQATNCANLSFAPKFVISTSGKTSKEDGASLSVRLTYPNAPFGTQANIATVKVDLPKQLPSRLNTLQKACTARQFHANPAGCPSASIIGHAKAVTPILPVPLEGPAYFVSNGGEAFPNLIIVLQGYGVTIDLVGDTFISKAGVTSSSFKTVPDQPVTSFELTLPQGPYSALAAIGNLCDLTHIVTLRRTVLVQSHGHSKRAVELVKRRVSAALVVPTAFTAQNGDTIHQTTPISVTGCASRSGAAASRRKHKRAN